MLADEDLDRIHDAAVRVLVDVGTRIMTEEGRGMLLEHGGELEGEDTVRIPAELVTQATNTTKPLMVLIAGQPELSDIYDMAEVVAGGAGAFRERPFVIP